MARRPTRLHRVLPRTDIVKASVADLAWIERGADGATVVSPWTSSRRATSSGATPGATVRAPRVTVVDTISAGDAFSAGFLAWWRHRGLGREELPNLDMVADAARFACLVASRTVERPGASPPRITL
jgi:fructokinase